MPAERPVHRRAGKFAIVAIAVALCALSAPAMAVEISDPQWGFDGKARPHKFNLLTFTVDNPAADRGGVRSGIAEILRHAGRCAPGAAHRVVPRPTPDRPFLSLCFERLDGLAAELGTSIDGRAAAAAQRPWGTGAVGFERRDRQQQRERPAVSGGLFSAVRHRDRRVAGRRAGSRRRGGRNRDGRRFSTGCTWEGPSSSCTDRTANIPNFPPA